MQIKNDRTKKKKEGGGFETYFKKWNLIQAKFTKAAGSRIFLKMFVSNYLRMK